MTTHKDLQSTLITVEEQYKRYLELAQLSRIAPRRPEPVPQMRQPVGLVIHQGR